MIYWTMRRAWNAPRPSDVEVDKVISFLEKVWRRLIEMGRAVQAVERVIEEPPFILTPAGAPH